MNEHDLNASLRVLHRNRAAVPGPALHQPVRGLDFDDIPQQRGWLPAAIVRSPEFGDLWVDDFSPATITGNVILTIGVNENNTESTSGEAVIRDNELGYVSLGGPVTVEGNEFPESMASENEQIGILVERGGGWVIRDNVVKGRQTGIQALPDGVIEGNIIEGNGVGLSHVGDPPAMSGNRICDNTFHNVRAIGSNTEIDPAADEICPDE